MTTMYYFSATSNTQTFDEPILCSYQKNLKEKDWIIIDLGYPNGIVTAQICKRVDEFKALTSDEEIYEVICSPIEIKEYEKIREKKVQASILLNQMEDMNREVALLEKCKKNASLNPKYGQLWETYQKLLNASSNISTDDYDLD